MSEDVIALGAEFISDPYALYTRLRMEQPVSEVTLPGNTRVWLVTRYAEARIALSDPRFSKDGRRAAEVLPAQHAETDGKQAPAFIGALGRHMLNTDPPDHKRLRSLVSRAFTGRRIAALRPRIEVIAGDLLDSLPTGTPFGLLRDFAVPLPLTVICELLGIPEQERTEFRDWTDALVYADAPEQLMPAGRAMAGYLTELVERKRVEPDEHLVSALTQADDAGDRLTRAEITATVFLLLIAGYETTVNLIGNGTLALLLNPDQLAALRADESLLSPAIEEFLRYEGPFNMATMRFTLEPAELGGAHIPAGAFVMVSLASANHDPQRYPDPDRLDLARDTVGHLAFGHGVHYCLGAPLARLEASIAFRGLLARFPGMALAVPPSELRWRTSPVMRGLMELPVVLTSLKART
ncbi:MAG: cytochrome P450 [Streptosporangiaceae bacterium]|nr:cytochrome P450 [Streptosporangiaceae bacterium]